MTKQQRVRATTLRALYAEGFSKHLEGRGYLPGPIQFRLGQLSVLDRWLRDHGLTVVDLDTGCVNRLVAARRATGRSTMISSANFALPISYLREIGVIPPEVLPPADHATQILEQYRGYLRTERGLVESSVLVDMRVAESFCADRGHSLVGLSAAEVMAYVEGFAARSTVDWSKKTVTALATFLRFLHIIGVTELPLAGALPKIAGHRRTVSCDLDEADFARLLRGCDTSRDVGLRDAAILTLLWRLGLRRSEITGLLIDDIDWRHGEITIRGKGNRHDILPIPIDVGDALVRYLREGHRRVPAGCRAVFVQTRAPEGPMSPYGIGDIVARLCHRAGLPVMGAHQLRRGTATQLVRAGASWPEIAQILRHRNVEVTASYATVTLALTRELARPWPGAR